jgi:hypothetical protein
MHILNGKLFDIQQPQVIGDTQYPPSWFEDDDACEAAGIELLHPTVQPDAGAGQRVAVDGYMRDDEGRMVTNWILVDLTADELAQIAADEAAAAAARVPKEITRRQALQAMLLRDKLRLVQPAIDAIPDPVQRGMVQIEFDASQVFERHRPAVIAIGTAIGLDAAGLDELFTFGSAL